MGIVYVGDKSFSNIQYVSVENGVFELDQGNGIVYKQPFSPNSAVFLCGAYVHDLTVVGGRICYDYNNPKDESCVRTLHDDTLSIQGISLPDFKFNQRIMQPECSKGNMLPNLGGYSTKIRASGDFSSILVSNKSYNWWNSPYTDIILKSAMAVNVKAEFVYLKYKPDWSCSCNQYICFK